MIMSVNGVCFNVDTPAGKTAYTIAAMKRKKAMKERKRYKDAESATIGLVMHCSKRNKGRRV